MEIRGVVVSTLTGITALDISSLRPNAPIVATVTDEKVAHTLALKWGIYTKIVPVYHTTDEIVDAGIEAAKEVLNLKKGDMVVIIGGFPTESHTNFLKIEQI